MLHFSNVFEDRINSYTNFTFHSENKKKCEIFKKADEHFDVFERNKYQKVLLSIKHKIELIIFLR